MEASREFSRTPPRLPPCSDVSVFQKTRMSHFWDTHHTNVTSAGLQAVFLPKEDSADTDAAERQLMARNDGRAEATCYSGQ